MGITIAPVPSIGELISQWGPYPNNVTTGFRASRSSPVGATTATLSISATATGTVYSTEVFPGIGYACGMVVAPSATVTVRPNVIMFLQNTNGPFPECIPWGNLLSLPVAPGLPDFRYTWESWHLMANTVVSAAAPLVQTAGLALSSGPGFGLGAGNPSDWWPNNPFLGFVLQRDSPNLRAFLAPGLGPWTPVVDVDTGIPGGTWAKLGMTIARVGGNAVIRWTVNGIQVAEFRPLAPVPLYSFIGRFETGPCISALRGSGASDDGTAHYWGGPGPSRIWLLTG